MSSTECAKAKAWDVGLVLRMQAKESCRVMSNHEASQLLSSSSSSGGGGGGGGGPMFYSRSNRVACFGDIYDAVDSGSSSTSGASDAAAVGKPLHPFNSSYTFNPLGEMTPSVNAGVPFTAAQWQELERQTIIYKYIMASVPVPPELLTPITKTQTNIPSSQSHGSLELGISSCNSDPEPWRCKRTDGKKWRCSRDVAPDQKYCERHSHKSRPRSRKPVELHADSMANSSYITNTRLPNQKSNFSSHTNSHLSIFPTAMVSAATSYDQPRSLEWFLKGETVPVASNSNQQWRHLKGDSSKGDEKVYHFQHHYRGGQLDSNSYMDLKGSHSLQTHRLNDSCSLLLSAKSATSLEATLNPNNQTQAQETRHFLDTWSSALGEITAGIGNDCCVSSNEKLLPLSSLTLSMCGRTETIEENENAQGGSFGIMGSDKDGVGVQRPQWMTHGSWMGSSGGPLAEALCLGISNSAKADSKLASSHGSSYGTNAGMNSTS